MRFKAFPFLITTLLALQSTVIFAQKKHQINVDIGLANYTNRDDLASPLLYKGRRQKFYDLSYTYKGTKSRHWVQMGIMTGKLKTSSSRGSADHYYGRIQYGYARLLGPRANLTFWLGGSWDNLLSAREYSFGSFSGRTTGIAVSNLNVSLLCELLSPKKQRVVFSLSVPMLGYLLRNGYTLVSRDITDRLISLNSYHCVRFSSLYEHTLSAYLKLRLTYWFIYQRYAQPRKTISVFHGLNGGISFQF